MPSQNWGVVQKSRRAIFFPRSRHCPCFEAKNYFCPSSFWKENKLFTLTVRALLIIGLPRDRKQGWKKGRAVRLQGLVGSSAILCSQLSSVQEHDGSWTPHYFQDTTWQNCRTSHVTKPQCQSLPAVLCKSLGFLSFLHEFFMGLQGLLQQVRHFH